MAAKGTHPLKGVCLFAKLSGKAECVMKKHNYISKIQELRRQGLAGLPGTVTEVVVEHADGCAIFRGGTCDCDANVKILKRGPKHREN